MCVNDRFVYLFFPILFLLIIVIIYWNEICLKLKMSKVRYEASMVSYTNFFLNKFVFNDKIKNTVYSILGEKQINKQIKNKHVLNDLIYITKNNQMFNRFH